VHQDFRLEKNGGIVMGQRYTPIEKVGICVPRSPVAFPSTILMNVIPAKIAGVKDIVLVTPPEADGTVSAAALAAAKIAGADKIFKVGGAQAVAALAYGTESIPKVDKIVGPGGIFVATAKRKVFGLVSIDMIAGPSEILVVADGKCDPRWVAADLLSQAEHDVLASPVLVTDSRQLAEQVATEIEVQLARLPRRQVARKAVDSNGKIIVTDSLDKAVEAAQGQIEAIRILEENGTLANLPEKLQEVARLRQQHPADTLIQLAGRCDPPITKSALNHRLRKLIEMSKAKE
jgi:histidinol dehydrogenase